MSSIFTKSNLIQAALIAGAATVAMNMTASKGSAWKLGGTVLAVAAALPFAKSLA